jgi:hypothetical protein
MTTFFTLHELCNLIMYVGNSFGQTHPWVVQLGTTSRNGYGTKNNQKIFLGPLL